MSRFIMIAAMTASLGSASAQETGEIPRAQDYAWQFPVEIERSSEYLDIELPLEVYRSVSDAQLRDLGVYNAAGQAVPRVIEPAEDKVSDVEHTSALGMIPIYGEIEPSQERLRLLMQHGDAGTSLQFDSRLAEQEAASARQLRAYIIDLRDFDEAIADLEFEWPPDLPDFVGRMTIEDGDDLMHWWRLAQGTLAELEYDSTRIEQQRIAISRATGDFLRLTWSDMPDQWQLDSVSAIRRARGPDLSREWLELAPVERGEKGREFIFDIGGYPPVDRLDLVLPGQNTVVRAIIDMRQDSGATWVQAHEGLYYRIKRSGHEITSPPARKTSSRASQWRVTIVTGQLGGDLRLRLGWRPDRLLFLAQGEPPFSVASGRAHDRVEGFPHQRLLGDDAIFDMLERSGNGGTARVGQRMTSAGTMVMEGARTWTWRTVLVWIGLISAVFFVGLLAFSLIRETKQQD